MVDLDKVLRLWRQRCKCRSIGTAFTAQWVEIVGGMPGFGRGASDGRMAGGGMSVGDIGIKERMEGGDGVPSLGSSQTHGGRHAESRLPLMGGVHVWVRCLKLQIDPQVRLSA